MALEEARVEVAKLRTEKYLAEMALEQERKTKAKAIHPKVILHDQIVNDTAGFVDTIVDTIKEMDNCTL